MSHSHSPHTCHRCLLFLQLRAADGVGFDHACSESEAELFPVRGRTYLGDRIKQPSASAAFRLISVLLVPSSRKLRHICASHPLPPRPSGAPPVVLIMFQVPGSPRLHLIFVLERDYTQDEVSADSPNTHTRTHMPHLTPICHCRISSPYMYKLTNYIISLDGLCVCVCRASTRATSPPMSASSADASTQSRCRCCAAG